MVDLDLRLKALSQLAQSESEDALAAIKRELDKAALVLASESNYELLDQQLQIVDAIGYRVSSRAVQVLREFVKHVDSIKLTYSPLLEAISDDLSEYHNAASLIVSAIDALARLRYQEVASVVRALLELSVHPSEKVRSRALRGLQEVAEYNIKVIHGDSGQPGIGFYPQSELLRVIEELNDGQSRECVEALIRSTSTLLSLTMESTSWTYNQVTISQGPVPTGSELARIRESAIGILLKVYSLTDRVDTKMSIVAALASAASTRGIGRAKEGLLETIERDAIRVLDYFWHLVLHEDFQILQKIEHHSYWIFFHAITPKVASAARKIESELNKNAEYVIYRDLIGFEGIFGDWEEHKADRTSYADVDNHRRDKARAYASSLSARNRSLWKQRILKFAKTQSGDLATFPIFYYFLEQVARRDSKLGLELIRSHTKELERFLIPLLSGLLAGPQASATRTLIRKWASEGRYIYESVKQSIVGTLDQRLARTLLEHAIRFGDVAALGATIAVAVGKHTPGDNLIVNRLFLPALRALTELSNADWVHEAWFRREAPNFFEALDSDATDAVLSNLLELKKIDYQVEEILYLIAKKRPERVIWFLCERLDRAAKGAAKSDRAFDAIPFNLHKLQEPLAKAPRTAVRAIRDTYDGNYGLFIHRGAHLLQTIFPEFPEAFEAELLQVLANNTEDDLLFVLAVLRNYEGQRFIHRICKEVVKRLPSDSRLRTEVAVALESTGVVSGEFGMAEAYEQKKDEVKDWLNDPSIEVQEFAKWYVGTLEAMIVSERQRATESIALRKLKYGE